MKSLALAIALLFTLPSVADAKCFLFIFCSAPRHHATPADKPTSAFCAGTKQAYAKSSSTPEVFANAFPENVREKVLECLQ